MLISSHDVPITTSLQLPDDESTPHDSQDPQMSNIIHTATIDLCSGLIRTHNDPHVGNKEKKEGGHMSA